MVVLQLTSQEDLEKAIQQTQLVVVYFYENDNLQCQKIGPWFYALEQKYMNQVQLYTVDIVQNRESANQYFVQAAPVFKYFRSGEDVGTVRGGETIKIDKVYEKIDEILQNNAFQQREIEKAAKLLSYVDTQAIDELDPSLRDIETGEGNGHHVVIQTDLPMRISLLGKEKTHTSLEIMNVKVLCRGDEQCPGNVRLEITSDKDIYFHYRGDIDEQVFENEIKEEQQLNQELDFNQFLTLVQKMITQVQSGSTIITMILDNFKEIADVTFQQDTDFRTIDLLTLRLKESDVESIKNSISYRINSKSQLNMLVLERLKDITKIIEMKNPVLLKEIRKGSQTQINGINSQHQDEPQINFGMQ